MTLKNDCPRMTLLVGVSPGGATDQMARSLAKALQENEGVLAVVENKPGASGHLAAQAASANCTLLVGTATLATNPTSHSANAAVYASLSPVAMLARNPMFFAAKPTETRGLEQMFADARPERPGLGWFSFESSFRGASAARRVQCALIRHIEEAVTRGVLLNTQPHVQKEK